MPEYLETTAGKFMFRVATDRLYTREGVWALPEAGGRVRLGLSDYPQQHSGDVAFANVKAAGSRLAAGEAFAEIETIKARADLGAPVGGTIVEANSALNRSPELINQSPYEGGWLAVLEPAAWQQERGKLLDAQAYFGVMQAQVKEELSNL